MESAMQSYDAWIGRDAYDSNGERIGEIKDIYYDDVSHRPEWVAVKPGMFSGTRLVPIAGARERRPADAVGHDPANLSLQLAHGTDRIKDAPAIKGDDGHLSADEERQLYAHYGYDWNTVAATSGYGYGMDYATGERLDRHYQVRDVTSRDDDVVAETTTVNEEVRKEQRPETVRLRKYQWTEQVPVSHEEVRVEKDTEPRRDA